MFTSIRYTFEYYDDPIETRAWFKKFIKEHNDRRTMKRYGKTASSVATSVVTDSVSRFIRIRHDGELIGYARVSDQARKVIHDVYVLRKHRKKGHYHAMLPNLVQFYNAGQITLADTTFDKYHKFYRIIGFSKVVIPSDRMDLRFVMTEKEFHHEIGEGKIVPMEAANDALCEQEVA